MTDVYVVDITTSVQMSEALAIRRAVFTEEQGIDAGIEVDGFDGDPKTTEGVKHVLVYAGALPVATGRLLLGDGPHEVAHIGRMAVAAAERGKGYGRAVMVALHDIARRLGYTEVVLGAEVSAVGFYERLGYTKQGGEYLHVGIDHQDMHIYL
jgi:predicted GNAT family N-acyltransferase